MVTCHSKVSADWLHREAVRSLVTSGEVSLYLGGPCRVYGEASMEQGCAVLEVALIPMLRITGMSGFVAPQAGGGQVMEMSMGWAAAEDLVCGPGFVEAVPVDHEAAVGAAAAAGDVPEDDVAGEVEEVRPLARLPAGCVVRRRSGAGWTAARTLHTCRIDGGSSGAGGACRSGRRRADAPAAPRHVTGGEDAHAATSPAGHVLMARQPAGCVRPAAA
jgi:hypothetical protein